MNVENFNSLSINDQYLLANNVNLRKNVINESFRQEVPNQFA